ncbi:hypothetical protein HZI73_24250 [Vallitalea pronyensis]|uniref:Uncharacterized protein n=1 Tax=Vallitalea pronyensis TaxID=1348613 RepID=A0A8J8MPW5_9FIRM|nr:hypothetical protein [Vallitalea pronyensis]QUI25218.1 hypothetical protein HZI73_24250 [Vallitalea pronyensis]
MNINKLKEAERTFFMEYPQGFDTPEMVEMSKKHKMDKLVDFAKESFKPSAFNQVEETAENMVKMVTRSSMVSLFEKPKFRDAVRGMRIDNKKILVAGLKELIHGDEEKGFNQLLDILSEYKLAKWTLLTVFRCYYYPDKDLLFKPTTVKNVIKKYELEGLTYKPRPSYDFFVTYRENINAMKQQVDASLAPNNAAFSGFLMMTMGTE